MILRTIFLLLLTLDLFAITLQNRYLVQSKNIKLRDIIPQAKYDITLYKINLNRHSKKIKSYDLIQTLSKHGYTTLKTSSRIITFVQESPINTSEIKNFIKDAYLKEYPQIKIHSLFLAPRGYITSLPQTYDIKLAKRFHLSKDGTLAIKTHHNRQIFFDYIIDAHIDVYKAREVLRKEEKLSSFNAVKTSIHFDKFKSTPVNSKHLNTTQLKKHIKANKIITLRDIETLNLVKKGSNVLVSLNNNNINISFSAKALQSGKLRDIITVQKSNKQRLKVRIVGPNKVIMK